MQTYPIYKCGQNHRKAEKAAATQAGRTRTRQATSHARNNWMISKIFYVSPLVTIQKIDQRACWSAGDK